MQFIWLGQGGLMIVSHKNKILVDPYMTNSLKKVDKTLKRRVRVKKKFFKVKPDIMVLTNSHPDHTDPHTLKKYLKSKRKRILVLSCENSFNSIADTKGCKRANHIMFGEGDEWTYDNLHFLAVKARTDDRSAFGLLLTDNEDGKKYYISSNTLYNEEIISSLPKDLYAAFLPISGDYGCMNMVDAERFARKLDAEFVVPINYGMFDKIDPEKFNCVGKIMPNPFKVIEFNPLMLQSLFQPRVLDRNFNEKKKPSGDEDVVQIDQPNGDNTSDAQDGDNTDKKKQKKDKVKKEKAPKEQKPKKEKIKKEKAPKTEEKDEEPAAIITDDYVPSDNFAPTNVNNE